jgi:hypothetical protein
MGVCVSRGSPIVPKEDVNYCSVELEVFKGTLLLPETFANEYTIVPDDQNGPFLLGHGSFSSGMCVVVFSLLSLTFSSPLPLLHCNRLFAFASLHQSLLLALLLALLLSSLLSSLLSLLLSLSLALLLALLLPLSLPLSLPLLLSSIQIESIS